MARLSIIVPAYENGAHLRPAVSSLLESRVDGLEVVVVDDGSTDDSVATIADLPVRIVRRHHAGIAAARNAGLDAATGEFVGFLDGDDLLARDGLASLLGRLETERSWMVAGGAPAGVVDGIGSAITVFGGDRAAAREGARRRLDLDFYLSGKFYPVSVWLYLFRRRFVDEVGRFDSRWRYADDVDLMLRVLLRGPIPVFDLPLVFRRVHATNASLAGAGDELQLKPEVRDEIRAIYAHNGLSPRAWNWKPFELGYDLPPVWKEA